MREGSEGSASKRTMKLFLPLPSQLVSQLTRNSLKMRLGNFRRLEQTNSSFLLLVKKVLGSEHDFRSIDELDEGHKESLIWLLGRKQGWSYRYTLSRCCQRSLPQPGRKCLNATLA